VSGDGETPEEVGEGDVVRTDTSLMTVPVSVRDRQGRFVYDLGEEDFSLYENGVRQEVTFFEAVETPFTVLLMLDTSSSTWLKHETIKEAAISFVNLLRPDDRVMVVSFANEITVEAEPTSDRAALERAIRGVGKGWNTRLYDAVGWAVKAPLKSIGGRKAVVLLTDGVSTKSKHATYKSNVRDVEELDALIYPVRYDTSYDMALMTGGAGIPLPSIPPLLSRLPSPLPGPGSGGPRPSRDSYRIAGEYLRELAEKTGGRLYEAGDDAGSLGVAFRQIVEELSHHYRLGYYPKTRASGRERRQLRVRVNRADVAVRARECYIYEPSSKGTDGKASTSPEKESR